MRRILLGTVLVAGLMAGAGCSSPRPNVKLLAWERGIAVASRDQPGMAMYLWFYEWNMFGAVARGQHTGGGYKQFARQVSEDQNEAVLTSDTMELKARAAEDGAELLLTITNRSDHDWPDVAGIIPCFNPGPKDDPNEQFANANTWFVGPDGLVRQEKREIHFNADLRSSIDARSDQGRFVFSHKWPTSDVDATEGLLLRESTDGQWVTGIAWERFLSAQGHNPWQCMHLCIRVGPLKRSETRTVRGRVYLFPGTKEDCLRRMRADLSTWKGRETADARR